jgi:hypothetical protein
MMGAFCVCVCWLRWLSWWLRCLTFVHMYVCMSGSIDDDNIYIGIYIDTIDVFIHSFSCCIASTYQPTHVSMYVCGAHGADIPSPQLGPRTSYPLSALPAPCSMLHASCSNTTRPVSPLQRFHIRSTVWPWLCSYIMKLYPRPALL